MNRSLLPFPSDCMVGRLVCREKRFFVAALVNGEPVWAHTNNTGSMLGLLRPGTPVLLSPASNPERKLRWTLELIWCGRPETLPEDVYAAWLPLPADDVFFPDSPRATAFARGLAGQARGVRLDAFAVGQGFWVGVNTSTPNRLIEAAFRAGKLPWATGYTSISRERTRGDSRLDARLEGPGLPRLWVECKNVTLAEDGVALFPDAVSSRGLKHLEELKAIVAQGERSAMFYCVQRPDGQCFAPADMIDSAYAQGFYEAQAAGVEMYPHVVELSVRGIDMNADTLPVMEVR